MSRKSLLDDAITKAKEAEDWQLVEWLRMARGGESAARWYTAKLRELEAENAKLRELVRDMYACIGALCSMVENSPGCSMCPTNQDEEKPCAAADVYCRMCELGVDA